MQSFTWRVKLSEHADVVESPVHDCMGYSWSITLFPQGQQVDNTISVFLKCHQDNATEPLVRFAFNIADHKDPSRSICFTQSGLHRFTKKDPDWGWSSSITKSLLREKIGIDYDCLTITAVLSDNIDADLNANYSLYIKILTADSVSNRYCHASIASDDHLVLNQALSKLCKIYDVILDNDELFKFVVDAHELGVKAMVDVNDYTAITLLNTTYHTGDYELKKRCIDHILPGADAIHDHTQLKDHITFAGLIDIINESVIRYREAGSTRAWKLYFNYAALFVMQWLDTRNTDTYVKVLDSTTNIRVLVNNCVSISTHIGSNYRDDPRYDRIVSLCARLQALK